MKPQKSTGLLGLCLVLTACAGSGSGGLDSVDPSVNDPWVGSNGYGSPYYGGGTTTTSYGGTTTTGSASPSFTTSNSESCPGGPSMLVGNSYSCQLPQNALVRQVYIVVGCNDGETGSFQLSINGTAEGTFDAACGTMVNLPNPAYGSASLYMQAGGGADNQISFGGNGYAGWTLGYDQQ
jgi:hypothetical protein